MFQTEMEN